MLIINKDVNCNCPKHIKYDWVQIGVNITTSIYNLKKITHFINKVYKFPYHFL